MDSKRCSLCGEEKPLSNFSRNRKAKDGYNAACSQCKKARAGTGKPHRPKLHLLDGYKQCSKCGEIKELTEFHRSTSSKSGYRSDCKLCVAEYAGWTYRPKEELPEGYKCCTTCKQILPATSASFKIDQRQADGLGAICKPCASAYTRQHYRDHLEERRTYSKKRYWANYEEERAKARKWYRENKERHYLKSREWRNANREYVQETERVRYLAKREEYLEKTRQWRIENRDRYVAYNQKWAKENPDKVAAIQKIRDARRRALKRKLPNKYTHKDWNFCLEYWDKQCAVCGNTQDLHADHWIPLSNPNCPGTVADNMICLCESCNLNKLAKDAHKWLKEKLGEEAAIHKLAEIEAYFEHIKSLIADK